MRHVAFVGALFLAGVTWDGLGVRRAAALEVTRFGDSGFLNVDFQIQARVGRRDQGTDATGAGSTSDFYVRRNRLSVHGAANETFGAVVQLEFNGGQRLGDTAVMPEERAYELVLLDAFVTANLADTLKVRAGKTKHVLTREVQEGCFDPLTMDRSLFLSGPFSYDEPEKSTRDLGLVLWGNAYDRTFQYRLAVMQGNAFGDGKPDGIGLRYTGRVHLTFFDKEGGIVYRGTYLGEKRVLTLGAGFEIQPSAVHSLGTTGAEDYWAYTLDAFYEHPTGRGTFTVSGAYLRADFGRAGVRGVADAQGVPGEKSGYYWKAGYLWRQFQIYGRWENWSFASLNGVPGQKLGWLAGGLNYYVKGEDLRFTLEYSWHDFDKAPARDFHTILLQGQARL
ncbi:MAG TPA: selenite/tellurite reduction operon porin ExtI [Anaeromyxobacteraceae bacterium]|nr:selenite/tellurite reduction operon porin ExtI [Anaeromyxobacteraceae bacterium]